MGGALIRCAGRTDDIKVVAAIEQPGNRTVGKDAGTVAGVQAIGVLIADDIKAAVTADVLIDFTLHNVVPNNVEFALTHRKPMIIGATGLDEEEAATVREAATELPVVWTPNMSLGVNLLFSLVKKASAILGTSYKIEINETHHVHKKDAPSGTALKLGQRAAEGRREDFKAVMVHNPIDKSGVGGKIVIHSHREGEVIGDHTVRFENSGEFIELTHHAENRDAFALGALHASKWIGGQKPGLYDMQDVLGL